MCFETKIMPPDNKHLSEAASLLQAGEVVGMPTETVYGLAANAYNPDAIKKIFTAKGRPQDNPLIVHIASVEQIPELVSSFPDTAQTLAAAFWPGPLTMILPKSPKVPCETTGGLDTVALRMPAHPAARQLIAQAGIPLAAPSANTSGRPSPTTALHVYQDMNGKIPLILDGGSCAFGVESTVIAVGQERVRILRPGGITAEMLQQVVPNVEIDDGVLHRVADNAKVASPGMKYKHYAPKADVIILDGSFAEFCRYVNRHVKESGVYALVFEHEEVPGIPCLAYGKQGNGLSQAQGLFSGLRKLDEYGAKTVYARCPEKNGIGLAVYNRLIRAAGFEVITL